MTVATIDVLEAEPDLGKGMPKARREQARRACVAALARIGKGEWNPLTRGTDPGGFGLLVCSGFIVRRVGQGGRMGAELLGPGDLLRPWQVVGAEASMPFEPRWTAITPLTVAVLDADFARRAAPFPGVAVQLVDRSMLRSRHLAIALAVVHQPRVDRRLHMLLWHFADRWGRLSADGVRIDVPLTHVLLSELVAARRPTVSTALGNLEREGVVLREGEGWRLRGGPPSELTANGAAG
ncbi:MAG: Crp/Fnr family transcriptional regulator [Solirubrobacterales bacterium]